MLNKPMGYDEVVAATTGERKIIQPGHYPAVICKVGEGTTYSGTAYIEFFVDIIDGEYARYYENDYKNQTGEKKWRGTVRYFTTEKSLPILKGAIETIEESNPGFKWDWDENKVKGKKIGVSIRREQYEGTDGTLKFATRPFALCSLKKALSGSEPPKDKLLPQNKIAPASPYAPPSATSYPASAPSFPPLTELDNDEPLPF